MRIKVLTKPEKGWLFDWYIIIKTVLFLTRFLKRLTHVLRKLTKKSQKSCSNQNNLLPLHREPAPRDVWHQRRGSRHIKKAFIDALFWRVEMSQVSKSVSGLSNGRCPTGYRLSLLCLLVRLLHIHICAHAYLNYVAREYILYSAWASRCCSKLIGNATASTRGTTAVGIHVFLYICQ